MKLVSKSLSGVSLALSLALSLTLGLAVSSVPAVAQQKQPAPAASAVPLKQGRAQARPVQPERDIHQPGRFLQPVEVRIEQQRPVAVERARHGVHARRFIRDRLGQRLNRIGRRLKAIWGEYDGRNWWHTSLVV